MHVLIYLSNINLKILYYYKSICKLVYIMFFNFKKKLIFKHFTFKNKVDVA